MSTSSERSHEFGSGWDTVSEASTSSSSHFEIDSLDGGIPDSRQDAASWLPLLGGSGNTESANSTMSEVLAIRDVWRNTSFMAKLHLLFFCATGCFFALLSVLCLWYGATYFNDSCEYPLDVWLMLEALGLFLLCIGGWVWFSLESIDVLSTYIMRFLITVIFVWTCIGWYWTAHTNEESCGNGLLDAASDMSEFLTIYISIGLSAIGLSYLCQCRCRDQKREQYQAFSANGESESDVEAGQGRFPGQSDVDDEPKKQKKQKKQKKHKKSAK